MMQEIFSQEQLCSLEMESIFLYHQDYFFIHYQLKQYLEKDSSPLQRVCDDSEPYSTFLTFQSYFFNPALRHQDFFHSPSSIQHCHCRSIAQSCTTLCDPVDCSTPSFPVLHYLPEFVQTYVQGVDDAILCRPLLLLPSILPSIRVFSNKATLCIRQPKYQSFIFSISSSNKYSGLIPFKIDWFDIQVVQGIPKVFFSTIVQKHQFFSAQPSLWSNSHIHT